MMKLPPAARAVVFAAGLVLTTTSLATAEEAATAEPAETPVEAAPAKPFSPTIYFGPSAGFAQQDHASDFGWTIAVLARPIRYLGLQIEYLNLGSEPHVSGAYDGVYFGAAPMLPVSERFDIFGQVGLAVGDQGDDVAAGAGVLYRVPFTFLETNNVDLAIRADYKYLNWADGNHLLTLGFMLGFHK